MKRFPLFLIAALLAAAPISQADDGVIPINQVCAGFGCMNGDSGGFPVTINLPGSYQLTSNLESSSNTVDVINITADNVTLDLNGFAIIGPRSCTGDNTSLNCSNSGMTAIGIEAVGRKNLVIRNGSVTGFDTGVSLSSLNSRGNRVEYITADQNEFGIVVINGVADHCVANRNLDSGFSNGLLGNLVVRDSYARGNGNFSAIAVACSNVYFTNNGSDNCGIYTNGSVCSGSLCP